MQELKPKAEAPNLRLSLLDLVTILYHVHRGSQLPDTVGFEDAERTLHQLTEELSPAKARIELSAVESALWSCNLMDEIGEWWSPRGESFDDFLNRTLRYMPNEVKLEFDKTYNLLRKSK